MKPRAHPDAPVRVEIARSMLEALLARGALRAVDVRPLDRRSKAGVRLAILRSLLDVGPGRPGARCAARASNPGREETPACA